MRFSDVATKSVAQTMGSLKSSAARGLEPGDLSGLRARYGFNELHLKQASWWHILIRQFRSSFIYLLFAAALVAFFLREFTDGGMILFFVAINTALGFYLEYRSEQTLKLLKRYLPQQVTVRRAGAPTTIHARELLPGDVVIIKPGSAIPADMRLINSRDLLIDESVLTGESNPVKKTHATLKKTPRALHKTENCVFTATTVVSGQGEGVVVSTGNQTVMAGLAKRAMATKRESGFEKGLGQFSTFIIRLVLITIVFMFLAKIAITGTGADIGEFIIFSIALAVTVIPEALPVVTTFSISRGALRLARHKVVVRRLSAIEDLGGIEVLCTDKTGTLTENKLAVSEIYAPSVEEAIILASVDNDNTGGLGAAVNAFNEALRAKLTRAQAHSLTAYTIVSQLPFDPKRRRSSVLVKHGERHTLIVKGAPEIILMAVHTLTDHERKELLAWVGQQGQKGSRVMAIAKKQVRSSREYTAEDELKGLTYVGLIVFTDPIKITAKSAILGAQKLGIAIKILTGDSKDVAGSVAAQVGLIESSDDVITGEELDAMPVAKQHRAIETYRVFARVSPEQKSTIIQVLEEKHFVGFLGEGINDAPALKVANVGIAVRGAADIASESADIVLLKKSLAVLVHGIQEGREVFTNTIKYIRSTLSSNFGNFYSVAIASLLINYLPMLPLQILLVNIISDIPMIFIATDRVDTEELRRPQKYHIREVVLLAVILGAISSLFDFIFFALFYKGEPAVLQTNWFIFSIVTELAFMFSIRTKLPFLKARRPSAVLVWLSLAAFVVTLALPFTLFGQEIFGFTRPSQAHLIIMLGLVAGYFAVSEAIKVFYYKMTPQVELSRNRQAAG